MRSEIGDDIGVFNSIMVETSSVDSPMSKYKSYLRKKYKIKKMLNYDKWPPSTFKKYVNLAVIEKGRLSHEEAKEKSKALTYGDIGKITHKGRGRDIQLVDIAIPDKDGVLPKFVLIEGAPGVGKSTFAWKACKKWAKGKILQDYELVILVQLRDLSIRKATCLGDLIQYPHDSTVHQRVVEEITKSGGKKVLLLLEGYDELPASLREEGSLFRNVIKGDIFDEGTVVVTSRHWASEPLLLSHYNTNGPVSKHIEILGFNRENIQDYLSFMLKEEPSLLLDITRYLELYPHIHSMMYIPLNCAIILEMYKNSRKENSPIPTTMTELYSSLIRSLLLRHMNDLLEYKDKCAKLTNLSNLPECIKSHFDNLAQLAYDGICNKDQHIIFTEDEIPSGLNTLGLMQSSMELYVDIGSEKSFNFLHLTIQEFLAAYHLLTFPFDEQVKLFLDSYNTESVLLRFLAGLSPLALENAISHPKSLFGDMVTSKDIYLMFEATNITVFRNNIMFTYEDSTFSHPFDYYMLGSVIAHVSCSWDVRIKNFKGESIQMFVNGILSYKEGNFQSILSLHIEDNSISVPSLSGLAGIMELCRAPITLKDLYFKGRGCYDLYNDNGYILSFFDKLSKGCPLLIKHLHFSDIYLTSEVSKKIESFLMSSTSTTSLTSSHCRFGLIDSIPVCNNIEKLCVTQWLFTFVYKHMEHWKAVNVALKENKMLKELHAICEGGFAYSLVESLCENSTLKRLVLECKCEYKSTEVLESTIPLQVENISTKIITENKILTELIMRCFPSFSGVSVASSLAKALCENKTLEKLEIGGIRFGVEGAEILASMLKNNTTLKELTLSGSILDDSEWIEIFKTLSSSLSHNVTLSKLHITLPSSLHDHKEVIDECSKYSRLATPEESHQYTEYQESLLRKSPNEFFDKSPKEFFGFSLDDLI